MRRLFACLAPAVAVFAFLALSGCAGSKPKPKTYSLGDRIELGHLVYKVFETQWLTQAGEGLGARVPQNRFFLIRLSVANTSSGEIYVPAITLINDPGKTFEEVTDGDQLPTWLGLVRGVKPVEPLQGNIAFDVPAGHYKLLLTDENEQHSAFVDIPLSFGADSEPMTLPDSTIK